MSFSAALLPCRHAKDAKSALAAQSARVMAHIAPLTNLYEPMSKRLIHTGRTSPSTKTIIPHCFSERYPTYFVT